VPLFAVSVAIGALVSVYVFPVAELPEYQALKQTLGRWHAECQLESDGGGTCHVFLRDFLPAPFGRDPQVLLVAVSRQHLAFHTPLDPVSAVSLRVDSGAAISGLRPDADGRGLTVPVSVDLHDELLKGETLTVALTPLGSTESVTLRLPLIDFKEAWERYLLLDAVIRKPARST
jgi:invasion protein IalB